MLTGLMLDPMPIGEKAGIREEHLTPPYLPLPDHGNKETTEQPRANLGEF